MLNRNENLLPAGYLALVSKYSINDYHHWHKSYITLSGIRRTRIVSEIVEDIFTKQYMPFDNDYSHLEFALKYDGYNFLILKRVFEKIKVDELTEQILSRPNSKYAHRIWFLYEFLTEKTLNINDLKSGNYEYLLEPDKYYTGTIKKSSRHKIYINMLGNNHFCPLVRRTGLLNKYEKNDLSAKARNILSHYNDNLLLRAAGYLYSKETKSSFMIEHVTVNVSRMERFSRFLKNAGKMYYCNKKGFIDAQNSIVDSRFIEHDYRNTQNYVGEIMPTDREKIHYVCPKPEDVNILMDGLIESHQYMTESGVSAVVHAAVISYGFVYIHPFEDGNGRIHRFLIHNILSNRQFTPDNIVFPVSAVMLKNHREYDASLETLSGWIQDYIEYSLDNNGEMTVTSSTLDYYKYIDLTRQTEALYRFIDDTINNELTNELDYLIKYDSAKTAIQEIVDMPDKDLDRFIKFCIQGHGKISKSKAEKYFGSITFDEKESMEKAVKDTFDL